MSKPKVKLIGTDGNIFSIMAKSKKALVNAGQEEKAKEMIAKVENEAKSYDEALMIVMKYIDAE